jgi:hypothetical protein
MGLEVGIGIGIGFGVVDQKKKFSVSMIYIILEFSDFTSLRSLSKNSAL